VANAAEQVAAARDEKRALEASAAELGFKLSQAERRATEEASAAQASEARLASLSQRVREAEARAAHHQELVAEQEHAAKEWEVRLLEADQAMTLADNKAQVLFNASKPQANRISRLAFDELLQFDQIVSWCRGCNSGWQQLRLRSVAFRKP
jgi:hypothetical protein